MSQQNQVLYSKIKVTDKNCEPPLVEKHLSFYANYSRFILKALKKTSFQEFLCQMLFSENIEEKTVNAVDIEVFPSSTKNGLQVAGRCNLRRGRIRIYPKNFHFCNALRKKIGKKRLHSFVGNRARAALMHELLHFKYTSDEKKVRELTDKYFYVYLKKQLGGNPAFLHFLIFRMGRGSK
jgi:hypothetical protein